MGVKWGILFVSGLLIGASDVVAGGGNLFTVSVLSLLGLPPLNSIATMQITTLVQDLAATVAYARRKMISWRQALMFSPFGVGGAFFGARLVLGVDQRLLSYLVGGLMLALLFLIPKVRKKKVSFLHRFLSRIFRIFRKKKPLITRSKKRIAVLMVLTLVIGIYGGFYGAAMGTLMLLAFFLVGEADILVTAGNTKVIDLALSLSASYVFVEARGLIAWDLSIPLVLGIILGTFRGLDWAQKFSYRYIRILLYLVAVSSALKLILFPHLG